MHDDQLNFAVPGTSFVGRGSAIERIHAGGRLVTLVGPPGVGKTRLAMEYVARAVRDGDRARGRLVDLVRARSPRDLCHAVARALGIVITEPVEERVRTVLAQSKSLIVALDNFEQLVDDCASLVAQWRDAATDLSMIVTSRRPLGLRDEHVIELAPLALPDAGSTELDADAAALFVERARAVRPGYAPAVEEAPQIVELVVRLDGLPLAIELAAARMGVMGPAQLLGRLGRVASLVDAVEWSWDLLSAAEQAALAQLSVFHGGFAAEAAEAVLDAPADALDHLAALRRHSLLTATDVPELPGELRFGMLEPIRDFAATRLENETDVRDRHAAYYLRAGAVWAETVEKSPRELARLAIELPNVLEVHRHALATGRPAWAIQASLVVDHLFYMRGPTELCIELLDRALAEAEVCDPVLRAVGLKARARALRDAGRRDEAQADLERALELASGDRQLAARIRYHLATLALDEAPARAVEILDAAVADARAAGDGRIEGMVLGLLGNAYVALGEHERAASAYDEALAIHRRVDNRYSIAFLLASRAELYRRMGTAARARADLDKSIELFRAFDEQRHEGEALLQLAALDHDAGDIEQARLRATEALARFRRYGSVRLEAKALERLDELGGARSEPEGEPAGEILIASSGRWFERGRERVDLGRRRALRLILAELLEERLTTPGKALDADALLAIGWPGERVRTQAGLLRVYNAIATLRRLGLREVLLRRDDGYLLDPEVPVARDVTS